MTNPSWEDIFEEVDLGAARIEAHRTFDRLWKEGHLSRGQAYQWLQQKMNLSPDDAHMKQMSVEQCEKVTQLALTYLQRNTSRSRNSED